MIQILTLVFFIFTSLLSEAAIPNVDFKNFFKDQDACFRVKDLRTGQVVADFNPARCEKRFSPCSTFKIAASLMAFEKGIFKDENQVIKWDGIKRGRAAIDRDQTPLTFMSESAKWVTEWILPQVGRDQIQSYLKAFKYGNQDFSGGLKDAWVTSSLEISAQEQIEFLSNLWTYKLNVSKRATDLTKKVMFIKAFGKGEELFGKTGTGCLVGQACLEKADKMIGWFVGVLKTNSTEYVIAANGSDLVPQKTPAGPRMREATVEILKTMELVSK